jgi:hypothetical protein
VSEPTSESIVDVLRSDHRAITAILDDPAAPGSTEEALAARERLVMDLVRHFVAEEQCLYPAVREHVNGGGTVADTHFAEDRTFERQLKHLEDPKITQETLRRVWDELRSSYAAHLERQEPLFDALTAACSAEQLRKLGDDVLGAEQLAPTRPRTVAPSSARLNVLTSLVEGYVDRVRDYYAKRGADTPHD